MESGTRSLLREIPTELIVQTIVYLPLHDINSFRLVSKSTNALCKAQYVWKQLNLRDFNHIPAAIRENVKSNASNALDDTLYRQLFSLDSVRAVSWKPLIQGSQAIERREGQAMALWGGDKLVLWGGFCQDPYVYVWDTSIESPHWEMCPDRTNSAPWRRYGHTLTAVNDGTVYMFGGLLQGGYSEETDELYTLKFSDREGVVVDTPKQPHHFPPGPQESKRYCCEWELKTPSNGMMSATVDCSRGYQSAIYDSKRNNIVYFGGINCGGPTNTLMIYNVTENEWDIRPGSRDESITPCPRFGHSAQIYQDKLYIAGGYTGAGMFHLHDGDDMKDIWEYCLIQKEWKKLTFTNPIPPRCLGRCHTSALFGNKLIFFGGTMQASSRLYAFNIETRTWIIPKQYRDNSTRATANRISHSAALVGTDLYVFAGCDNRQRPQPVGLIFHMVPTDDGGSLASIQHNMQQRYMPHGELGLAQDSAEQCGKRGMKQKNSSVEVGEGAAVESPRGMACSWVLEEGPLLQVRSGRGGNARQEQSQERNGATGCWEFLMSLF
eukprot:TRINITY_DN68072_c8_g6_i2.p1 TRINITY_DN68072_c8_g6~~TRINITY_DN68072_c8_g6_i2.p1  ORF type:complete len:558 (+),score=23.58 TRINITY_DN68072_c8_g6_i2:23-1675(+)